MDAGLMFCNQVYEILLCVSPCLEFTNFLLEISRLICYVVSVSLLEFVTSFFLYKFERGGGGHNKMEEM